MSSLEWKKRIVRYSLPVRLQKEHRTRKGGNKKLDLIPQKTQH